MSNNNVNNEYTDDFLFADLEQNERVKTVDQDFIQGADTNREEIDKNHYPDNMDSENIERAEKSNSESNNEDEKNDKSPHSISWVSLALFFSSGIVNGIFAKAGIVDIGEAISGLCVLASFVTMIVANVMYPKDVVARIIKWLWIVGIVFFIVMIVLIIIACNTVCSSCSGM